MPLPIPLPERPAERDRTSRTRSVTSPLTPATDAAPGEHGRTGPAVTNTFRVIADNSYSGTGVAISTQGYILTSLSIVSHCDGRERCSLGVTDDTEHPTWRPATIAAIDR